MSEPETRACVSQWKREQQQMRDENKSGNDVKINFHGYAASYEYYFNVLKRQHFAFCEIGLEASSLMQCYSCQATLSDIFICYYHYEVPSLM